MYVLKWKDKKDVSLISTIHTTPCRLSYSEKTMEKVKKNIFPFVRLEPVELIYNISKNRRNKVSTSLQTGHCQKNFGKISLDTIFFQKRATFNPTPLRLTGRHFSDRIPATEKNEIQLYNVEYVAESVMPVVIKYSFRLYHTKKAI